MVIFPCPHSDRIFLVPKAEVLPLYQPVAIEISGELPELHFQTANTAGMRKLQDAATPQACVRRLQDAANSQGDQHNVNSAQGRFLEYDTESDSYSVYSQRQRGSSLAEEEGDGYDDDGTITYDHVQEGDCDGTEGDCDGSQGVYHDAVEDDFDAERYYYGAEGMQNGAEEEHVDGGGDYAAEEGRDVWEGVGEALSNAAGEDHIEAGSRARSQTSQSSLSSTSYSSSGR